MIISAVTVNTEQGVVVVDKIYTEDVVKTTDLYEDLKKLELGESFIEKDEKSIFETYYTRVA